MSTQDTPHRNHDTSRHDLQTKSRVETPEDGLFISQYPYRRQEIPDNVNPRALINSRPILLTQHHHLPHEQHVTAQPIVHPNRPHIEEVRFDQKVHKSFHYPRVVNVRNDIHTTTDYRYPHLDPKRSHNNHNNHHHHPHHNNTHHDNNIHHRHNNEHHIEQFYDENDNLITIHHDPHVKTITTKHVNHNPHRDEQTDRPQSNNGPVITTNPFNQEYRRADDINQNLTNKERIERRRADELIHQVKDHEKSERREHLAHLLPDMDPFAIDQTNDILSDIARPNHNNSNVGYNMNQLSPESFTGYTNPLRIDPVQPLRSTNTQSTWLNDTGKSVDQQRRMQQNQGQLKKQQQQAQRSQNILASRFDSGGTLFGALTQQPEDMSKKQEQRQEQLQNEYDTFTYPVPSTKNTTWSDRDDYKENNDSYDRYIKQNRKDITHQAQSIKQDAKRVQQDVIDLVHDIKDAGKDAIQNVTNELQHDTKAVSDKVKDLSHTVLRPLGNPKSSWKQNIDSSYNVAHDRPSTANMTAFISKDTTSSIGGAPGVVYNLQVDKDSPHYQEVLDKMEAARTPYSPNLAQKKQEWQNQQALNRQLKEQREYTEQLNKQTMLGQQQQQQQQQPNYHELNIDDEAIYQQYPLTAQTRNSAITSNRQLLPQQQSLSSHSPSLVYSQVLSPFHPSLKQSDNLFYTKDQKEYLDSHLGPSTHRYHESHRDQKTTEMPAKSRIVNRKSLTDLSNDYFHSLEQRGAATPAQKRQMWRKDLENKKTNPIVSALVPTPVREWASGVSDEVDKEARAMGRSEEKSEEKRDILEQPNKNIGRKEQEAKEKQVLAYQHLPPRPDSPYYHPKALSRHENDKFEKEHEAYISSSYLKNNKVYNDQVGGDLPPIQPHHVNKMKELDFFETNPHHSNPNLVHGQRELHAERTKGDDYIKDEIMYPSTFINQVGKVASNVVNKSSALLYTTPSILATKQPDPQHVQKSESGMKGEKDQGAKSGFYDRLDRGVKSLHVNTLTDDDLHGKEYYIIDKSINTGMNAREKVKDNIVNAKPTNPKIPTQQPQSQQQQQQQQRFINGKNVDSSEKLPLFPVGQKERPTPSRAMGTTATTATKSPTTIAMAQKSELNNAPLPDSSRSQLEQQSQRDAPTDRSQLETQQIQRQQSHRATPPSNPSHSNDYFEKYNVNIVEDVTPEPKPSHKGGFWSGIANASSNLVNSVTSLFYNSSDRSKPAANIYDLGQKTAPTAVEPPQHPHKVAHKIDDMMNKYEDYQLPVVNRMMDKVDDKIDRAVDRTYDAIDRTIDRTHDAIDKTKSSYHNAVDKTKHSYHDAIDSTKDAVSNVAHKFDDIVHPNHQKTTTHTTIYPIDRSSTNVAKTTTSTRIPNDASTTPNATWSYHHDHPSFDHDFSSVPYLDSTRNIRENWKEHSHQHHEASNEDHTMITHPLTHRSSALSTSSTSSTSTELPHQRRLHTIHDNTIIDAPLLRHVNAYPHEHIDQLQTSATAHLAENENRDGYSYMDDVGNIFYIHMNSSLSPHQQSTTDIPSSNDINKYTQHGVTTNSDHTTDTTIRERFDFDPELATAEPYYEPVISHDHSTHGHTNSIAETICDEKLTIQDLANQFTDVVSDKLDKLTHSTLPHDQTTHPDAPLPNNGAHLRTMTPDGTVHTVAHPPSDGSDSRRSDDTNNV